MVRVASTLLIVIILSGCASHPKVSSQRMAEGDVEYGYAFSVENVFPYLWYRKGISKRSDIGVRVGLPIYGSGLDYSRLLYEKEHKWDMLNLAWNVNPNFNYDFTYYKFKQRYNKKTDMLGGTAWTGIRFMHIPKGINDKTSTRIGLLFGGKPGSKLSYEVGYFHDFSSMPIGSLFSSPYEPEGRFEEFPHTTDFGLPSENSRITGFSLQVFLSLGYSHAEKKEPKVMAPENE
jgi:hypothetical protein